jgi:hypothetical protein
MITLAPCSNAGCWRLVTTPSDEPWTTSPAKDQGLMGNGTLGTF